MGVDLQKSSFLSAGRNCSVVGKLRWKVAFALGVEDQYRKHILAVILQLVELLVLTAASLLLYSGVFSVSILIDFQLVHLLVQQ